MAQEGACCFPVRPRCRARRLPGAPGSPGAGQACGLRLRGCGLGGWPRTFSRNRPHRVGRTHPGTHAPLGHTHPQDTHTLGCTPPWGTPPGRTHPRDAHPPGHTPPQDTPPPHAWDAHTHRTRTPRDTHTSGTQGTPGPLRETLLGPSVGISVLAPTALGAGLTVTQRQEVRRESPGRGLRVRAPPAFVCAGQLSTVTA